MSGVPGSPRRAEAFAERVSACGTLSRRLALRQGWNPATIDAAIRRGLVGVEYRPAVAAPYQVLVGISAPSDA